MLERASPIIARRFTNDARTDWNWVYLPNYDDETLDGLLSGTNPVEYFYARADYDALFEELERSEKRNQALEDELKRAQESVDAYADDAQRARGLWDAPPPEDGDAVSIAWVGGTGEEAKIDILTGGFERLWAQAEACKAEMVALQSWTRSGTEELRAGIRSSNELIRSLNRDLDAVKVKLERHDRLLDKLWPRVNKLRAWKRELSGR